MTKKQPPLPSSQPSRPDRERRQIQADRLAAVLRLLHLLMGHRHWTAAELAKELECSQRTVHRQLTVLRTAGYHVYFDAKAQHYRMPFAQWPVTNLSSEELLGLAMAASLSKSKNLVPGPGATPTAERISARVRDDAAECFHAALRTTEVRDLQLADHAGCRDKIRTIQWALVQQRQMRGIYRSPQKRRVVSLTLHPYRLCLIRQAWYLIARESGGSDVKTYRVMRFQKLDALPDPATIPDFDLDAYLGNAWGVFRGSPTYRVRIEFTEEAADLVTETRWHPTQAVDRLANGCAVLSFQVDGLEEILWWVLGWSGRARVLEPKELREMVLVQARKAIALQELS